MIDISELCDARTHVLYGDGVGRCGVMHREHGFVTCLCVVPEFVWHELHQGLVGCPDTCRHVVCGPIHVDINGAPPIFYMGDQVIAGKRMRHLRHQTARMINQMPDGHMTNTYGVYALTILSGTSLAHLCVNRTETRRLLVTLEKMAAPLRSVLSTSSSSTSSSV